MLLLWPITTCVTSESFFTHFCWINLDLLILCRLEIKYPRLYQYRAIVTVGKRRGTRLVCIYNDTEYKSRSGVHGNKVLHTPTNTYHNIRAYTYTAGLVDRTYIYLQAPSICTAQWLEEISSTVVSIDLAVGWRGEAAFGRQLHGPLGVDVVEVEPW